MGAGLNCGGCLSANIYYCDLILIPRSRQDKRREKWVSGGGTKIEVMTSRVAGLGAKCG